MPDLAWSQNKTVSFCERSSRSRSTHLGKQLLLLGWGSFNLTDLGLRRGGCIKSGLSHQALWMTGYSAAKIELGKAEKTALPVFRGSSNVFIFLCKYFVLDFSMKSPHIHSRSCEASLHASTFKTRKRSETYFLLFCWKLTFSQWLLNTLQKQVLGS